jgi:hypothetical protein
MTEMKITATNGEMVIYISPDGTANIDVRLEAETLWLTQNQLEELFSTDRTSLVKHIKNILNTGELVEATTCAKFAQVRLEGKRTVSRDIRYYNLDMILSVGYRVNSKRGTQFRMWANRVLKEHLVQGYTINQKRLTEQQNQIERLKQTISMVERSLLEQTETIDDARKVVKILSEFARGLNILDDYDHETLEQKGKTEQTARYIPENEFLEVVQALRRDFDSAIFGQPKDKSFSSSVNQIYQTFGGAELYPSIEHKAAMLLYWRTKYRIRDKL